MQESTKRLKFNTGDLLSRVILKKQKMKEDHQKAVDKWVGKCAHIGPKLADLVVAQANLIETGDFSVIKERWREDTQEVTLILSKKIELPNKPNEPNYEDFDNLILALESTADKTVSLTPSEVAYFT